ncbi:hypothetical protein G9A89_023410 [Geosiphon pyriformis]|nr:hypothetical protein G9A89_023410 [Geosiphon pyriformis]
MLQAYLFIILLRQFFILYISGYVLFEHRVYAKPFSLPVEEPAVSKNLDLNQLQNVQIDNSEAFSVTPIPQLETMKLPLNFSSINFDGNETLDQMSPSDIFDGFPINEISAISLLDNEPKKNEPEISMIQSHSILELGEPNKSSFKKMESHSLESVLENHNFMNDDRNEKSKTTYISSLTPESLLAESKLANLNPLQWFREEIPEAEIDEFKKFAQYAKQAYCLQNKDKIAEGIYWKVQREPSFDDIVVNFRGDERELPNIVTKKSFDPELFARYFPNEKKLFNQIQRLMNQHVADKIIFVGHSLGSAMAVWAGGRAIQRFPESKIEVYTFAEPRISIRSYAVSMNEAIKSNKISVYRFTMANDFWIQRPDGFFVDAMHHGTEYLIESKNRVFRCRSFVYDESRLGASLSRAITDIAHDGPYFGYTMGKCQ